MGRAASIMSGIRNLQVEPVLFLFSVAGFLHMVGSGVLAGQKLCHPEGPPGIDVVCTDTDALKELASLNGFKMNLRGFLPGVMVLLAGSWRDHTGLTQPLVLLPHIGEIIAVAVQLVSSLSWGMSAWATAIVDSLFGGITGSRQVVNMACFLYLTEHTPPEERTSRMSLMNVIMLGSICIPMAMSGYLLAYLDYAMFFLFSMVLYIISIGMTLLLVKDGKRRDTGKSGGPLSSLSKFKVVLQSKPNHFVIWLFIFAISITMSTIMSEMGVSQLHMQKKFHFTPKQGGLYGSYKMFLNIISSALLPIIKKFFKVSDFAIVIYSLIPAAISSFGVAMSNSQTTFYIFDALGGSKIIVITTLKSLLTKCLKKSESGVYTSLLSFGDGLLPLFLGPLYTYVFQQTVETMPGAFHFISGTSIILIGILVSICSQYYVEIPDEEVDEKQKDQ